MNSTTTRNLWLFTMASSIWAGVFGLIGPFFVLRVDNLSGGMEKLGFAFSIMILAQSLTTYFSGRFSDRLGRKPLLFFTAYVDAFVLFAYTVIEGTCQLYVLQATLGITNGVAETIQTSLLGDLSVKERRGHVVGRFMAIVSFFSAIGVSASGYLVKYYGLDMLFYVAAVVVVLSTGLLVPIKEEREMRTGPPPSD